MLNWDTAQIIFCICQVKGSLLTNLPPCSGTVISQPSFFVSLVAAGAGLVPSAASRSSAGVKMLNGHFLGH